MNDTNLETSLKKANDKIERNLYGFNLSDFSANLDSINELAQKSLKTINSLKVTGDQPDLIEFIDREFYNSKAGRIGKGWGINVPNNGSVRAKNYENTLLSDLESGKIDLAGEDANSVSRQARYRSIDSVCSLIPQLMRILHIYRDSIMSPNAFSELSETDGLTFDVKQTGEHEATNFQVLDTLLNLNKEYKVSDEVAPKACSDLLKYGDGYVCVLDYEKEVNRLLHMADDTPHGLAHEAFLDRSSEGMLAANEAKSLNNIVKSLIDEEYDAFKSLNPSSKEKKPEFKDLSALEWSNEIDKFLNVEYTTSLMSLFPEEKMLLDDLIDSGSLKSGKDIMLAAREAFNSEENTGLVIDGSIVKVLDPKKVVIVEIAGKELGYYFLSAEFDDARIDALDYNPQGCPACDLTYTSDRMYSFITHMGNSPVNKETRASIIADLCLKRLSKKIDRKFIAKNKEFKDFIFSILRAKKRLNKVTVTFIPASNLVHFKRGNGTYGESVLDSVLYFAKLYVLSMLSALMQQIIMGKDKQIFYVDTGLDEDSEGAIQKFIMDFRSKEVTVDDFSDVTNIMNRVTKSNSMFIPMVDGKKAVEFDNYAGQQAEFNNDFLQDLLKSIISGTGIPTAWLDSGMSDIEFATQLVQQNGNVLRTVTMYQRVMNNGITRLFQLLYKHQKIGKDTENQDNIPEFFIHYPEPVTLDSKVAEESISKAQSIADFIINTLIGENPNDRDNLAKEVLKRELTKKYSAGIDWEEAEELLKKAREETQETALRDEAIDKKAEETHDEEAEKHPEEAKKQEEEKQEEEGGNQANPENPEEEEETSEENEKSSAAEKPKKGEENEEEEESEGGSPEEDFFNS